MRNKVSPPIALSTWHSVGLRQSRVRSRLFVAFRKHDRGKIRGRGKKRR